MRCWVQDQEKWWKFSQDNWFDKRQAGYSCQFKKDLQHVSSSWDKTSNESFSMNLPNRLGRFSVFNHLSKVNSKLNWYIESLQDIHFLIMIKLWILKYLQLSTRPITKYLNVSALNYKEKIRIYVLSKS